MLSGHSEWTGTEMSQYVLTKILLDTSTIYNTWLSNCSDKGTSGRIFPFQGTKYCTQIFSFHWHCTWTDFICFFYILAKLQQSHSKWGESALGTRPENDATTVHSQWWMGQFLTASSNSHSPSMEEAACLQRECGSDITTMHDLMRLPSWTLFPLAMLLFWRSLKHHKTHLPERQHLFTKQEHKFIHHEFFLFKHRYI